MTPRLLRELARVYAADVKVRGQHAADFEFLNVRKVPIPPLSAGTCDGLSGVERGRHVPPDSPLSEAS